MSSPIAMDRQHGFSLLELTFALVVLTIVIMTTLTMFAERSKRLQQAGELMLAYQALGNEAELMRRVNYGALDQYALTAEDAFMSSGGLLARLAPFKTNIEVAVLQPGVKRVTMEVRWSKPQRAATLELIRVDTGATNLW